jgi:hypothetical protein
VVSHGADERDQLRTDLVEDGLTLTREIRGAKLVGDDAVGETGEVDHLEPDDQRHPAEVDHADLRGVGQLQEVRHAVGGPEAGVAGSNPAEGTSLVQPKPAPTSANAVGADSYPSRPAAANPGWIRASVDNARTLILDALAQPGPAAGQPPRAPYRQAA